MKPNRLLPQIFAVTAALLFLGGLGAYWPVLVGADSDEASRAPTATLADTITYQGQLTNPGGTPLSGNYTMRFILYDSDFGGSAIFDTGNIPVNVSNGLFTVDLDVDQGDFHGDALWIDMIINGQTLSPRQAINPAPYALGLKAGAEIVAPATGFALYSGGTGGYGIYAESTGNYAVYGSSTNSWGGYFTSQNGYGLVVDTNGNDHYDHGILVDSNRGYAIYARSTANMGVRGEAGDTSNIPNPLGPIGVVGLGQNRGVVGSSNSGTGVFASSQTNYGVWGQSVEYRGVTGRTSRADNNYGLYTPDNLFSSNYNRSGAVMQVVQNNSDTILAIGDVVAFNGIEATEASDGVPIVQVTQATARNAQAVAGVVYSRFNIEAVRDVEYEDVQTDLEVTPAGDVAAGEYLLIVVQGPAQVNIAASRAEIAPGDLLAVGSAEGYADKAPTFEINGISTVIPGTVFGKALETPTARSKQIWVYVTLD